MATRVMLADNKPITDDLIAAHIHEAGFLWGQPKIDGMRVMINQERIPVSRSGKEWKHKPMRKWAQDHPSLYGLDGEVVAGHEYREDSFRESMSGMRAAEGSREFTFYAFDLAHPGSIHTYAQRLADIEALIFGRGEFQESDEYHVRLVKCPTERLDSVEAVRAFEEKCLLDRWEGAMLRRPDRPYKFGRSTNKQGSLIKLKRYEDAEAIVTGYEPWYQNANEATTSPLGYTVRSSHQEGKIALERLGAWHVELLTDRSVKFSIGVMQGVTHTDRDRLWANREEYIGRICKFKHQGYGGGYDVPRQPVFLNWRDEAEFTF